MGASLWKLVRRNAVATLFFRHQAEKRGEEEEEEEAIETHLAVAQPCANHTSSKRVLVRTYGIDRHLLLLEATAILVSFMVRLYMWLRVLIDLIGDLHGFRGVSLQNDAW